MTRFLFALLLLTATCGAQTPRIEWCVSADALAAGSVTLGTLDSSVHVVGVYVLPKDSSYLGSSGVDVLAGDTVLVGVRNLAANGALGAVNYRACNHYTVAPEAVTVSAVTPSGILTGKLRIILLVTYL